MESSALKKEGTMNIKEKKELFEKIKLKNGLDLIILVLYKHTAGDRCQVTFEAEIDVKINEEYLKDQSLGNLDITNIKNLLGEKTSYLHSKTRNFISEAEKDIIFEGLKQQFLDNNLPYISSPSFPAKLIKRNYILAEKEDRIRLQREEYLKKHDK